MNVRVAVIDSGIGADDALGHGTQVAALIRRRAPGAELFSFKIFEQRLLCPIQALTRALAWCAGNGIDLANLSVGTPNPDHAQTLLEAVLEARAAGVSVVSAYGWLPGNLTPVIAVDEDRTCPTELYRIRKVDGRRILACHGESKGVSFAVANGTGFLAAALGGAAAKPLDLLDLLVTQTEL